MTKRKQHAVPLMPRIAFGVAWAFLVGVILTQASQKNWLPDAPDQFTYDLRTLYFSDRAKSPRNDIAVVLVTDDTLTGYASRSPVDRGLLARLVTEITASGAKAIGLDFVITQPTDNDEALLSAIRAARDKGVEIVLAGIDERWPPLRKGALDFQEKFIAETATELKKQPAKVGHILFGNQDSHLTIADQAVRFMIEPSEKSPDRVSLAQQLAEFDGPKPKPETNLISWLLPPKHGLDTFATIEVPIHRGPEAEVTGPDLLPDYLRAPLAGKIVLIGGSFVDRDLHQTPLSVLNNSYIPGVMIHAEILAQLRDGRSILTPPRLMEMLMVTVVAGLGFLVAQLVELERREWVISAVFFAFLVLVGIALFWGLRVVLPSATIALAWPAGIIAGNNTDTIFSLRPIRWAARQTSGG